MTAAAAETIGATAAAADADVLLCASNRSSRMYSPHMTLLKIGARIFARVPRLCCTCGLTVAVATAVVAAACLRMCMCSRCLSPSSLTAGGPKVQGAAIRVMSR